MSPKTPENRPIVTRFAPSPTGIMHVGNVRTAIFNYLFTKQNGGKVILRIEDTDKERSKKEYEEDIVASLKWLGLSFDEFFRQSEREAIYKKYLKQLIDSGAAYVSQEEAKEAGQRSEVIRFKNPNKRVKFDDLIRGEIEFDTTDLKDFVIAKSLEEPLYHLAVVVDDFEMGVTHVVRGEDHISNTPRQILLQEAMGAPRPTYAHIPLIFAPDRTKLSKRKHGESVSLKNYRDKGYLPEALVNFMALLGWNPGDDREIFSLAELVKEFNLAKVQKGGAIFNTEKLNWINKEYLKKLPISATEEAVLAAIPEDMKKLPAYSEQRARAIAPIVLDRINAFGDIPALIAAGEIAYFFAKPDYAASMLFWKGQTDKAIYQKHLQKVIEIISALPAADFTPGACEKIKSAIMPYAESIPAPKPGGAKGEVLWPTRIALCGREKSPDPFTLIALIGKDETITRLTDALAK